MRSDNERLALLQAAAVIYAAMPHDQPKDEDEIDDWHEHCALSSVRSAFELLERVENEA